MNIGLNNPKTVSRLWAALSCDFEALLARFMGSKGWRYYHFASICREMQITLVLHITQGRGKFKDEYYLRVMDMILQMCKDLWLRSADDINHRNKSGAHDSMELKRGLGGFYLLYTMFEKQPSRDRVKISLGISDMYAFQDFCVKIRDLSWAEEIFFMLNYLNLKEAYQYSIFSEEFRFDASTRNLFEISHSEVVYLTRRMRDAQDVLAYSDVHHRSAKAFHQLNKVKSDVVDDLVKTLDKKNVDAHLSGQSAFALLSHTLTSSSLQQAMRKLDQLLDKPVMTLQGLTATEAIERRIMMETRRKIERARKKALQTVKQDGWGGVYKEVRPYVREGGIFGRKKETEEGEDKIKRRQRGACYGNLWVYINCQDFDKPVRTTAGDVAEEICPPEEENIIPPQEDWEEPEVEQKDEEEEDE